jgi:hypothetical protein
MLSATRSTSRSAYPTDLILFEPATLPDQRHILSAGKLAQRRRHEDATRPIHLDIGGVANQEAMQITRAWVEARQAHEPLLNGFPVGRGVDQ